MGRINIGDKLLQSEGSENVKLHQGVRNLAQYISWMHTVERILADFEIARYTPVYCAIFRGIQQDFRIIIIWRDNSIG